MIGRLHVCGYCGSGEYNCPCRDRDDLRRMIGVALFALVLCGVLARAVFAQESASVPALASRDNVGAAAAVSVNAAAGRGAVTPASPAPTSAAPRAAQGLPSEAAGVSATPVSTTATPLKRSQPGERERNSGATERREATRRDSRERPAPTSLRTTAWQGPAADEAQTRHSPPAAGQPSSRAPVAVLLARVAVNEDSRPLRPRSDGGTDGAPSADTLAIVQTARAWAAWQGRSLEASIRALAPYVSGTRPAKSARHAAYAALPAHGSVRPLAWAEDAFGSWAVHGPRWAKLRAAVAELVRHPITQCAGEPIAWGGPMDDHIAIGRGLVRLDCGPEVVNSFWGLPTRRSIAADLAGGRDSR